MRSREDDLVGTTDGKISFSNFGTHIVSFFSLSIDLSFLLSLSLLFGYNKVCLSVCLSIMSFCGVHSATIMGANGKYGKRGKFLIMPKIKVLSKSYSFRRQT